MAKLRYLNLNGEKLNGFIKGNEELVNECTCFLNGRKIKAGENPSNADSFKWSYGEYLNAYIVPRNAKIGNGHINLGDGQHAVVGMAKDPGSLLRKKVLVIEGGQNPDKIYDHLTK